MSKARQQANLSSDGNLFADISNDRVGVGSVVPTHKLHVNGTSKFDDDVKFEGTTAAKNIIWDKSADALKVSDNSKLHFGAGEDLSIYHLTADHDGYIKYQNENGHLKIGSGVGGNGGIQLWDRTYAKAYLTCDSDDAVKIYFNNSKKLETTNTGAKVTGNLEVTGVLTYDDVTSVDSVGIVTAQAGIHIDDSITHIGDTNTKIRFPAVDQIQLETGGSSRVNLTDDRFQILNRLLTSGDYNYLSGTSSTHTTLTLKKSASGADSQDYLQLRDNSNALKLKISGDGIIFTPDVLASHEGDTNTKIRFPAADTFSVETAGDERLRINSSGRLVVGHTAAIGDLHGPYGTTNRNPFVQIHGTNISNASMSITSWDNNVVGYYGAGIFLARSGSSTKGTNSRVTNINTILGSIIFSGDDGTDFVKGAMIQGAVDNATGDNDMPGRLQFLTTPDGAQEPIERLRIDSNGNVAIDKTSGISAKLHIGSTNNDGSLSQLVKLANDSSGSGTGSQLNLGAGHANESNAACIAGFYDGTGTSFIVKTTGTYSNQGTVAERLRIDSSGRLKVGSNVRPASDANEGAGLRVTSSLTRNQYYSPHGHYFGAIGYVDNTNTKAWLAVDSAYANSSAVSAGIFLSAFHQDAGGSGCGFTIKNLKDGNPLVISSVTTASSTNNPAVETERLRITSGGSVRVGNNSSFSAHSAADDLVVGSTSGSNGMTILTGNATGNIFFNDGSGNDGVIQYVHSSSPNQMIINSSGQIEFDAGGSERLRIESDGNITFTGPSNSYATIQYASNFTKLDLRGNGIANSIHYILSYGAGHANADDFHIVNKATSGNLVFRTGSAATERFAIDSSGRVGINKFTHADTASALTIQNGATGSEHTILDIVCNDNETSRIYFSEDSNTGNGSIRYTYTSDGNYMGFYTNGTASSAERLRIDSSGNTTFKGSGTDVQIKPTDGLINFGMDGRSSLVTGESSCYIFSGSGASGDMPAGTLVLQARANVDRNILFATGSTPARKWLIQGSGSYGGRLRAYNSTNGNGQTFDFYRPLTGTLPTANDGVETTIINTNSIGDAGAYVLILRSFEQSQTGGKLWSLRIVSSVFYIHSGSGNDGDVITIPSTYSGHHNGGSNPPVTLKMHIDNGPAHTHGKITWTPNSFSYTGSNCDYYFYKLIDV